MKAMREGRDLPFNFEVIDPSGNSFVQNPKAPQPDIGCIYETYLRTVEDYTAMGYNVDEATLAMKDDKQRHEQMQAAQEEQKAAGSSKAVSTTQEEQDKLLAKI